MSVELIIASFEGNEDAAGETLKRIKELQKQGVLSLRDAAVIVKPKEGEVEVKDIGDVDAKRGAIFGAITGAVVGLLGGPIGAIAGAVAGAATGGAVANVADYGVSDKMIQDIEKSLPPGSSAIITYVELTWVDKAVAELEKAEATVYHETIKREIIEDLERKSLH